MSISFRLASHPLALRSFLVAEDLFALLLGRRLAALRENGGTAAAFARVTELERRVEPLSRWLELVAGRWEKVPERRRPHWGPRQRFEILTLKRSEALSARETARRAGVSRGTILRWEAEVARDASGDLTTVGSLVVPVPPLRRISDVVRAFVQEMSAAGFEGARSVALHLVRSGVKLSATTVRRIRRERIVPRPPARSESSTGRTVVARGPGHVFMADLTDVSGWLGAFHFKVGVVMDAFSRFPVAWKVFVKEPSGPEMRGLLVAAFRRAGAPAHLVSDRGMAFRSRKVRKFLRGRGVRHRFGAIGRHGSIALIERLWRTLKQRLALRSMPPLVLEDLERRIQVGLEYYAKHRPHQGLRGATPFEVFHGLRTAMLDAVPAPRGQPGDLSASHSLAIEFLDRERLLPVLVRAGGSAIAA